MSHISTHKVKIAQPNAAVLERAKAMLVKFGQAMLGQSVSMSGTQHLQIGNMKATVRIVGGELQVSADTWRTGLTMEQVTKAVEKCYRAAVAERQVTAQGYTIQSRVNERQEIEIMAQES